MLEKLKLKVGLGLDMPQWVGNRRLKWPLTTQIDPWGTAQHLTYWASSFGPFAAVGMKVRIRGQNAVMIFPSYRYR